MFQVAGDSTAIFADSGRGNYLRETTLSAGSIKPKGKEELPGLRSSPLPHITKHKLAGGDECCISQVPVHPVSFPTFTTCHCVNSVSPNQPFYGSIAESCDQNPEEKTPSVCGSAGGGPVSYELGRGK